MPIVEQQYLIKGGTVVCTWKRVRGKFKYRDMMAKDLNSNLFIGALQD